MVNDFGFDLFVIKALPYMLIAAAVFSIGLAMHIRLTKPKIF